MHIQIYQIDASEKISIENNMSNLKASIFHEIYMTMIVIVFLTITKIMIH